MEESDRCVSCGHLPDVCQCPHDCVTEADEAARLADLEQFLGTHEDLKGTSAEDVFSLIDRSVA